MKTITKLWIGIIIMVILSPLGLIIPEFFKAKEAWGEWGAEEIQKMVGYVPEGIEKLGSLWKAPFPDYAFAGMEDAGIVKSGLAYIFSAIIGIALTAGVIILLGRLLTEKTEKDKSNGK
jgi:nitrate reductase gamma subunit